MKICSRCEVNKKNSEFNTSSKAVGGLHSYCRPCFAEYRRKLRYGLEEKEYRRLERKQRGKCAICSRTMGTPIVDHNHATQAVRGLLCRQCNTGIGQLSDNPLFAIAAASYLVKDLMREVK